MRLFGSERIAKLMDRMGLEEGEVIQHSMVSKSIERAQKKVEENNFGVRKRLLEYDDVMNQQREVIYKKRKHALHGDRLSLDVANMIYDTCENIVEELQANKEYENFKLELIRLLATESPVSEEEFKDNTVDVLTEKVYENCYKSYQAKSSAIASQAFPVIKDVFENQAAAYENIVIPFTDGLKTLQVVTNLKEAHDSEGENIAESIEKSVTLAIIDDIWKEHLREMDDLKQAVQTASYEQKDPLLIYKFESFNLFKALINKVNKDIVSFLIKAGLPTQSAVQEDRHRAENHQTSRPENSGNALQQAGKPKPKVQPIRAEEKVERNAPCPCGSGKKFKKCHGK
jgi:preprotein translocase subunit SecA